MNVSHPMGDLRLLYFHVMIWQEFTALFFEYKDFELELGNLNYLAVFDFGMSDRFALVSLVLELCLLL